MNQQSKSQSQSQGQNQSQRRTDGPFVDDTERAGHGLHPGSDRDDYGSPHGIDDTVGTRYGQAGDHERERREPGQVEQGDDASQTDTGAPAGYGDRGRGGVEPGQGWPEREDQQGRVDPDSEHARQAEQGESGDGAGHPHGDYDIG